MRRFFVIVSVLFASLTVATAQQMQVLPNDPEVRVGKLENGMTYYIRHNDKPEKRAEFYLATNVGAIQETPDQDGLAHFLEHMCFNGTKNFPGKSLLDYLQGIGASFGGNINAGTGVEQTTYMLNNMPLLREGVVDTCLLIMHDYSHFVTCDPVEIDNERGVILEERRSRRTADWRMYEQSLPYYYGDSKYGSCTLIGSQENLSTFKPESLVNFYQTWYRPDLQALIVVGDVDVDQIEAKIKTMFADIPAAVDPKPKDVIKVPDNEEPVIGIITDPETSSTAMEILWKSERMPEEMNNTVQGFTINLLKNIISSVMNERFQDIVSKPGSPFLSASFGIGDLCQTLTVAEGQVYTKDGEALSGLNAFLLEIEKMKRFGFTDSEIERAKTEILSQYETRANRADTRKNSEFIQPLLDNFFDNYAFCDPQTDFSYASMIMPQLQSQVVNMIAQQFITENNMVLVYKAPQKEGLAHPEKAEFLNVISSVRNAEIEAPAAEEIASSFIDSDTLKGAVVSNVASTIYGASEWTLGNGLKVYLYPTDFEKDRIRFQIYKKGGISLAADEDMPSFESNLYSLFRNYNGVSQFSGTTVTKMLSGKQLSVSQNISSLENGISGTSTGKDIETALQLMYLYYTDPRFDEDAYAQAESTIKAILPNMVSQPDYALQKEAISTLYDNDPRAIVISEDVLNRASLATIERVTRELYKDATGSNMIIVGDFDPETIKPLIEKYVGSLPTGGEAPMWKDAGPNISSENKLNDFKVDMQTPKATCVQVYRVDTPYSVENEIVNNAIQYILDIVYTATLREDEGGTYGASVSASTSRNPRQEAYFQIAFETNPSSADKLSQLAKDGLRSIAENGPTAEQFEMAKNNMLKNLPESRINNSFWMSAIKGWIDYSVDKNKEIEEAVNSLTPEKIKDAAAHLLNDGNLIEIIMRPDKTVEAE